MLQAVHHAQIIVGTDQVEAAREFYCGLLGLQEIPKPASLLANGGFWCQLGAFQVHIGVEAGEARKQTKAHLAYAVTDLESWREKLLAAGLQIQASTPIPGMQRFECRDPFGNRMEFLELQP